MPLGTRVADQIVGRATATNAESPGKPSDRKNVDDLTACRIDERRRDISPPSIARVTGLVHDPDDLAGAGIDDRCLSIDDDVAVGDIRCINPVQLHRFRKGSANHDIDIWHIH